VFLQPISNPPDGRPLCRESDLSEMLALLNGSLYHGNGRNLFICGKPGTGKTACIHYVIDKMHRCAVKSGIPLAVGYVNAGRTRTPYFTMLEILKNLGLNIPASGWQMFRLKGAFEQLLHKKAVVLAVDEFDALLLNQRDPLVYYLSRQPRTTLILISNKLEDVSTLPPRLLSTLRPKIMMLQSYTADEAKTILKDRASRALYPNTATDELLNTIAEAAAQAEDIRLGFAVLLSAAHLAEEKGKGLIDVDDVEQALRDCGQISLLVKIRSLEQKLKTLRKNRHDTSNTAW
jgi:Cdc6-like AAA superfamily ATPase